MAESGGNVTVLGVNDTFDEVRSGVRLILSFDSASNAFVGTAENTTNGPLSQARVEVHLSNGTELSPTQRVDLAPGEVAPLNLASTAAAFDTWTAHPEVGSGEGSTEGGAGEGGAEHGAGSEGGGEGGNEGGESGSEGGGEGGGQSAAPATQLVSTDISRGVAQSGAVAAAEAYTGNLNGLEIAATFDATTGTFHGRVKNEAGQPLCDTRVAVILDGTQVAAETIRYPRPRRWRASELHAR